MKLAHKSESSEAEKGILSKKKKNSENALTLKDLETLNDELKLLLIKDFWNENKRCGRKLLRVILPNSEVLECKRSSEQINLHEINRNLPFKLYT